MGHSLVPLKILIVGAGSRGWAYANAISRSCPNATVNAVAEPQESRRTRFAATLHVPEDRQFKDWRQIVEFADNGKKLDVDGVMICTLDSTHVEISIAFCRLGYHILCEKPLATTLKDGLEILKAARGSGKIFGIGHVMRYSPHSLVLKKLLSEDKRIGDIVNIQHTEPVGYWHFAHSYVRGNWRNERQSSFSLMTKCCHDIDLLMWLISSSAKSREKGGTPISISSTGSLVHFRKESKPPEAGSAKYCAECPLSQSCAFSAERIYGGLLEGGCTEWPVNVVVPEIEDYQNMASAREALRHALSPEHQAEPLAPHYGKCVYELDNDVCDNQVVTMAFRGGVVATLTMIAFTEQICMRRSVFYGTRGELSSSEATREITVFDFGTQKRKTYQTGIAEGGHGGGDVGLTRKWIEAIWQVDREGMAVDKAQQDTLGCSLDEIERSHRAVFVAEQARLAGRVIRWDECIGGDSG